MSTTEINDYLTKQLSISKAVVTFRSLSRDLGIHVNNAKNELAAYHSASQSSSQPAHATYILSGEVVASAQEDGGMDVDDEDEADEDVVTEIKVLLVGEKYLEKSKSQFSRIHAVHVYSLSPSILRDAGLISDPNERVRQVDSKKGPEFSIALGKVVGADVQLKSGHGRGKQAISSSKVKPPIIQKPIVTAKSGETEVVKEKVKEKLPQEKPKATGKLDFSKAKPKDIKKKEPKAAKSDAKQSKDQEPSTSKTKEEAVTISEDKSEKPPKRGVKRKSAATNLSDSENDMKPLAIPESKPPLTSAATVKRDVLLSDDEEEPPTSVRGKAKTKPNLTSAATVRVKRGVLLSDDDEEPSTSVRGKAKTKPKAKALPDSESEAERSLKAMMDIDDEQVIKASRPAEESKQEEEEDVDVNMEEDQPKPKPKTRKKKEKKEIPVGRNGLKKKRVVKSRTNVDDKGYMVTEDYSSYESVDEEEAEAEVASKPKGKKKAAAKQSNIPEDASQSENKSKSKKPSRQPSTSAAKSPSDSMKLDKSSDSSRKKTNGQQNLSTFFGKTSKK